MTKISIITPCYNAADFLPITFNSVTAQNHQDWEWVLVDDCSTDNTWQVMQELAAKESRIKIYQNETNSGAAVTRNHCMEKSTGQYLAFLDCDDLWVPSKLTNQLKFMEEVGAKFSYHNYETINADGKHLKEHNLPGKVSQSDLLKFNPFATSSIMIEKQILTTNNIKFLAHLRRRQDYLFWYEAIGAAGLAKGLSKTLSGYRVFGKDSLSANKKEMAKIQWNLYRNEFKLGPIPSLFYFFHYAWHGIKKYFL